MGLRGPDASRPAPLVQPAISLTDGLRRRHDAEPGQYYPKRACHERAERLCRPGREGKILSAVEFAGLSFRPLAC